MWEDGEEVLMGLLPHVKSLWTLSLWTPRWVWLTGELNLEPCLLGRVWLTAVRLGN